MPAGEIFSNIGEEKTLAYEKVKRMEELRFYLGIFVVEGNNHNKT
jgi:hypothetical protein